MCDKRTDIHAPSAAGFDPAAYACYGCWDNSPEGFFFGPNPLIEFQETVRRLLADGYRSGPGSIENCGHCGARIRYFALLVRDDVKEFICVGEQCLDNRFSGLTAQDFQALRKQAKLNRERATRQEALAALKAANPAIARLLDGNDPEVAYSEFLSDVRSKAHSGRLSDAQVAAVGRAFEGIDRRRQWAKERAEQSAALAAAGVQAPEGRVEIEGLVVSVKEVEGFQGDPVTKIIVKTDAGWSAWLTLPAALAEEDVKGQRIRVTVTLTRSDKDATFAFGKRPSKAVLLATVS
jgi:hypothetical protein